MKHHQRLSGLGITGLGQVAEEIIETEEEVIPLPKEKRDYAPQLVAVGAVAFIVLGLSYGMSKSLRGSF